MNLTTKITVSRKRILASAMVLVGALAVTVGCSSFKNTSIEGDTMLGVALQGPKTAAIRPLVAKALERPVYTPQTEYRFNLKFVTDDSLGPVSKWQNVLLLGSLDSDDPVSQRVQRMLKEEALQGVREGKFKVFRQRDVWVRRQTVVVVAAATRDDLIEWLKNNGEQLYQLFAEDRTARLEKQMFSQQEQTDLEDSLRKAHGWFMRIPHDFAVVASHQAPDYVRLRRLYPDRLITIAWRPGQPESVNVDSAIAWIDSVGAHFADPIEVKRQILATRTAKINNIEAMELDGVWATKGPLGGGPYVAYLLYADNTLYLLFGQVFAPDRAKEPFLRQVDLILHTFKP